MMARRRDNGGVPNSVRAECFSRRSRVYKFSKAPKRERQQSPRTRSAERSANQTVNDATVSGKGCCASSRWLRRSDECCSYEWIPDPTPCYSSRKAEAGSIRATRNAGMAVAMRVTTASPRTTAAMVVAS